MKAVEKQIEIIENLIGKKAKIKVKEDGFLSRGFVVDDGRLVFKFPRNKNVSYKKEIANLNFINELGLNVNLQRVAFVNENDEYLGVFGVLGESLENVKLNEQNEKIVGEQLGVFLKQLHEVNAENNVYYTLKDEITVWQKRVEFVDEFIKKTFEVQEQEVIRKLMFEYMPKKLKELGEKLVFSHADLGDGNIFVDENLKVGVIDFNESGMLDEAGDFMDISSEIICEKMLNAYGADEVLRKKVEIRRDIRPLIVLKPYLTRNDEFVTNDLVAKIRKTIKKYEKLF